MNISVSVLRIYRNRGAGPGGPGGPGGGCRQETYQNVTRKGKKSIHSANIFLFSHTFKLEYFDVR